MCLLLIGKDLATTILLKILKKIKIQNNNSITKEMSRNIGITDDYLNIDIKMETGTGKTFTQIKTIYELNEKYGFNKFIIVVPTLPIKAGTKQFISSSDTRKFFEDEYNQVEMELRFVESIQKKKGRDYFPSVIREFVTASNLNSKKIQIMLINSQLITNGKMLTKNYDTTILDDLTNPSEAIKSTKPILIIDEPHKFAKENVTFNKIKEILKPQCIIRFGATFPEKRNHEKDYQNLVYNLGKMLSLPLRFAVILLTAKLLLTAWACLKGQTTFLLSFRAVNSREFQSQEHLPKDRSFCFVTNRQVRLTTTRADRF